MKATKQINMEEVAFAVFDMGITLGVLQDLYSIAVDVMRTDAEKASSMFVAIDRYMDDLSRAHGKLEDLFPYDRAKGERSTA